MKLNEYVSYDATGLAELLRSGVVSASEVQEAAQEAIDRVDGELNALVGPLLDKPLDYAPEGVFGGVPFLLKDAGAPAAGLPYEVCSRLLSGYVPAEDSETVRRFKRAGLAVMGRTATPEFTLNWNTTSLVNGSTRNPWDTARVAGGSSGGAAALVAAGAVPMAHATDGAGSIRIPAACCGIVGLKTTRHRLPQEESVIGDETNVNFVVTRSLRDTAALLDQMHGPARWSPNEIARPDRTFLQELSREPEHLRIGVLDTERMPGVSEACTRAVRVVAQVLEQDGHEVFSDGPTTPNDVFSHEVPGAAGPGLALADTATFLAAWVDMLAGLHGSTPSPDNLESVIWKTYQFGKRTSAVDLRRHGSMGRLRATVAMRDLFNRCDVLVSPVVCGPAPLIEGSVTLNDDIEDLADWWARMGSYMPFTSIANASGNPAISLPLGTSDEELPIGVQLIGAYGHEARLLRLASRLESDFPWRNRVPRVWAGRGAT